MRCLYSDIENIGTKKSSPKLGFLFEVKFTAGRRSFRMAPGGSVCLGCGFFRLRGAPPWWVGAWTDGWVVSPGFALFVICPWFPTGLHRRLAIRDQSGRSQCITPRSSSSSPGTLPPASARQDRQPALVAVVPLPTRVGVVIAVPALRREPDRRWQHHDEGRQEARDAVVDDDRTDIARQSHVCFSLLVGRPVPVYVNNGRKTRIISTAF